VYQINQGVFMPKQENVKIPVAIKELSQSSGTELLEEARIMASVMHPCCIRIMAVCVTRQMMLVTPLMAFGSLLDYLHRNSSNVGSRSMLTWAKQIAQVCCHRFVIRKTLSSAFSFFCIEAIGNLKIRHIFTSGGSVLQWLAAWLAIQEVMV